MPSDHEREKLIFLRAMGLIKEEQILDEESVEGSPSELSPDELFLAAVKSPYFMALDKPAEPQKKKSSARKRKSSKLKIEHILDLHGYNRRDAIAKVQALLYDCQNKKISRVLIVHGKGSGILREEISAFLQRDVRVHHIERAPGRLGGDGAILVFIRRG